MRTHEVEPTILHNNGGPLPAPHPPGPKWGDVTGCCRHAAVFNLGNAMSLTTTGLICMEPETVPQYQCITEGGAGSNLDSQPGAKTFDPRRCYCVSRCLLFAVVRREGGLIVSGVRYLSCGSGGTAGISAMPLESLFFGTPGMRRRLCCTA